MIISEVCNDLNRQKIRNQIKQAASSVQWWLINLLCPTEGLFIDILDTHSAF